MTTETWVDKSDWGDGPWQEEPDRIEWRDGEYVCLMLRNPSFGMWCGYVGLRSEHPWHGKGYDDIEGASVHGGLTFAGPCMDDDRPQRERVCHMPLPGEPEDLWWLGFDCHHYMDLAPGMRAFERRMGDEYEAKGDMKSAELFRRGPEGYTYRHVAYVRSEVEDLVAQAKEAA